MYLSIQTPSIVIPYVGKYDLIHGEHLYSEMLHFNVSQRGCCYTVYSNSQLALGEFCVKLLS
jgi:hypothetical protein